MLLIVPLMALTIGAQSLAGEQERSTLTYLLAQPVTRLEVFLGKYLGLLLSLLASLALGFGIAGLVMALNGAGAGNPHGLRSPGRPDLPAQPDHAERRLPDLGPQPARRRGHRHRPLPVAGLCLPGRPGTDGHGDCAALPIEQLFLLALANPLQVFKMASILDINATLDILGPAGIFAMQEFGRRLRYVFLGVMALWIVVPALLAYVRFASKSDL